MPCLCTVKTCCWHKVNKLKCWNTKSFILRVDATTMGAIEKWAADEFRSTNGQLQWIITEALRKAHRLPKQQLRDKAETKTTNTDNENTN